MEVSVKGSRSKNDDYFGIQTPFKPFICTGRARHRAQMNKTDILGHLADAK